MATVWCCPYFRWEEKMCVFCEGGKVRFKDGAQRREYIFTYCAAMPGWEACTIAQSITKSYERAAENARKSKAPGRRGSR